MHFLKIDRRVQRLIWAEFLRRGNDFFEGTNDGGRHFCDKTNDRARTFVMLKNEGMKTVYTRRHFSKSIIY